MKRAGVRAEIGKYAATKRGVFPITLTAFLLAGCEEAAPTPSIGDHLVSLHVSCSAPVAGQCEWLGGDGEKVLLDPRAVVSDVDFNEDVLEVGGAELGQPILNMQLTAEGARRLAQSTRENLGTTRRRPWGDCVGYDRVRGENSCEASSGKPELNRLVA